MSQEFDARIFADICTMLGIGTPRKEATPVTGGLLHRLWRIETDCGIFAVKVLNPEIMSRPSAPQNYRNSERVARAAKNCGVQAVTARTVGDDPWMEINGTYIMVFDWQEGRTLQAYECTAKDARKIGRILFQIHELDIKIEGLSPAIWSGISEETWLNHIDKACCAVSCWGVSPKSLLDDALVWSHQYKDAACELEKRMVISHGDLDPKNVIWDDKGAPFVIDWESAGYVNPTVELIEAAINWSRNQDDSADKSRFQAVIEGYVRAGGLLHGTVLNGIYGSMGGMLGWLEYNMRRSVDEKVFDDHEKDVGQREVKQTVRHLKEFSESVYEYAQWIDEISG